ncbi:hypothetical protein [Sphaerisporangium sp. NPDC051011]|uniref:hypothetical protein n=1 Tax=Sphaerisporangium sp. NPDC051011 TaxID=3155792 RepID=UPI0034004917
MRVVWLGTVLAGLLAALTVPPSPSVPPPAPPFVSPHLPPAPPGMSAATPLTAPTVPPTPPAPDAVTGEHPEIWGHARVVRGTRSLVIGTATASEADLADLARRADRASLVVARVAGPVRPLVLVPATTAQAATLAAPASVDGLAAVAATDRVIIEPGSFARLSDAGRDVVLAHELTHVATGAATDARTPKWLVEGFADYVGYLRSGIPVREAAAELAAEVRAGRTPSALPGPDDFAPGSPRLAQAYEEAWLACRYVAARYGEPALVALYREFRRGDRADAAGALPRALGVPAGRFTGAWRAYVKAELS